MVKTVEFHSDEENEPMEKLKVVTSKLPVCQNKASIVAQLKENRCCVLVGETGSGKSTQIPQFLLEMGEKRVAITQPRRVAAINLASRVAEECGTKVGNKVGYSVRFDNKSGRNTKIKYLTDGMLLREMMLKSDLSNYSTVIIDEAHERTILTDLILGFLKDLLRKRSDLRVIIMSATLDAEMFSKFFDDCAIVSVPGRAFPVEHFFLEFAAKDITDAVLKSVLQINSGEEQGDVLVFLPGQEEIDKVCSALNKFSPLLDRSVPEIVAFPLYASLPPQQQLAVFQKLKKHQRKIVVATNIAETSLTVPGVRYVVDSGLRKINVWKPRLGMSALLTVPVSKASASQRAGRAGRERSGKVFRLYRESDFTKLPEQTEPEIVRSDVAHCVLMLKKLGVSDVLNWNWLENPGEEPILAALSQLYLLKALDESGKITPVGEKISVLPVAPRHSAVLLEAFKRSCLIPVIEIIACLSVENLLLMPPDEIREEVNEKRRQLAILGARHGDLLMLKELLDCYTELSPSERKSWCKELHLNFRGFKNVVQVKDQLKQYMKSLMKEDIESNDKMDVENILKSFIYGYIHNSAIGYPDRSFRTVFTGQLVSIHPSSVLFGKRCDAIMYTEFVYTSKGFARNVSNVQTDWLKEVVPNVMRRTK